MGVEIKPVYVILDPDATPRAVNKSACVAWESFIISHFGTLYGGWQGVDYARKKRKLTRRGYRCYRMVKG